MELRPEDLQCASRGASGRLSGKMGYSLRWPVALMTISCVAAMCQSGLAHSQVMAIGSDGNLAVYSGPAVFTDHGVTPIAPIQTPNTPTPAPNRGPADPSLQRAAVAADLSPDLLAAVAWRESNFRSDRTSKSGAVGEMQLMPATARWIGVDPWDRDQNLLGGASYLRALLKRYNGDLARSLAAYNAGPGAVDRYNGLPPYKETRAYVGAILDHLSNVAQARAPRPADLIGEGEK